MLVSCPLTRSTSLTTRVHLASTPDTRTPWHTPTPLAGLQEGRSRSPALGACGASGGHQCWMAKKTAEAAGLAPGRKTEARSYNTGHRGEGGTRSAAPTSRGHTSPRPSHHLVCG